MEHTCVEWWQLSKNTAEYGIEKRRIPEMMTQLENCTGERATEKETRVGGTEWFGGNSRTCIWKKEKPMIREAKRQTVVKHNQYTSANNEKNSTLDHSPLHSNWI